MRQRWRGARREATGQSKAPSVREILTRDERFPDTRYPEEWICCLSAGMCLPLWRNAMRTPMVCAVLVSAGMLFAGMPLAAQMEHGKGQIAAMDSMSECPMMTAEMRGPGAALDARAALHLSQAQLGELETIKATLDGKHKVAMDRMMMLHRQIHTLAEAPAVDEGAARGAFDRMGQLHGQMGFDAFRAQLQTARILTAPQRDSLAALGRARMNSGDMKSMGGCS